MDERLEDAEEDQPVPSMATNLFTTDPITGVLLGRCQTLTHHYPSHQDAMKLWVTHVENVEPLCKILHIPTTTKMVETIFQRPSMASKADECLLFVIYHFAVFSMSDEACVLEFGQSLVELISKYQHAVWQALLNASWLKTTEMPIIQACVLFLISIRTQIDPHLFWILTGIAVRIAERMGLHRDGECLGLSPFDVKMRRRVFWQFLPLDGYAGQIFRAPIAGTPNHHSTLTMCRFTPI